MTHLPAFLPRLEETPPVHYKCGDNTHGQGPMDPYARLPETYEELLAANAEAELYPFFETTELLIKLPRPIFPLHMMLSQPRLQNLKASQAQLAMDFVQDLEEQQTLLIITMICRHICGRTNAESPTLLAKDRTDILKAPPNPEEALLAKEISRSYKTVLESQPDFALAQEPSGDVVCHGHRDHTPWFHLESYHAQDPKTHLDPLPASLEAFMEASMSDFPNLSAYIDSTRKHRVSRAPMTVRYPACHLKEQVGFANSLRAAYLRGLAGPDDKPPAAAPQSRKKNRRQRK